MRLIPYLLLALSFSGPTHAGPTPETLAIPTPVNPRAAEGQRFRCLVQGQLMACNGSVQLISHLPDAEQIVIAPNGRVFVAGASEEKPILAELLQDGTLQDVEGTACTSHTGLEIRPETVLEPVQAEDQTPQRAKPEHAGPPGGRPEDRPAGNGKPDNMAADDERPELIERTYYTLFAACFNGASVSVGRFHEDAPAVITDSFTVTDAATPNGTALDRDGRFYVTNGPIANGTPYKINRFTVTVNEDGSVEATEEDNWFGGADGLPPFGINGLDHAVIDGVETLFYAEGGGISSIQIGEDGQPASYRNLYYRLSPLDDLTVVEGDGIYFGDFMHGSYGKLGFDGNLVWETAIGTVMSATHIVPLPGEQNLFYVTDKGILGDPREGRGNALYLLTVDQDAITQLTESPL